MTYAVQASNGKFYNGRAGTWEQNLSAKSEAFLYGKEAAERKAAGFNAFSKLHGFTFIVVEV